MWQHINDEQNVYFQMQPETGIRNYYSPTMYVRLGMSLSPEEAWKRLSILLQSPSRSFNPLPAFIRPGTSLPRKFGKHA